MLNILNMGNLPFSSRFLSFKCLSIDYSPIRASIFLEHVPHFPMNPPRFLWKRHPLKPQSHMICWQMLADLAIKTSSLGNSRAPQGETVAWSWKRRHRRIPTWHFSDHRNFMEFHPCLNGNLSDLIVIHRAWNNNRWFTTSTNYLKNMDNCGTNHYYK